jgi:hypothetical protein
MKKIALRIKKDAPGFVSAILLSSSLAGTALATTAPTTAPTIDIMEMLGRITDWLFAILLIIGAIWIIIAGYYFVTAQGDPDKTKTARNFVLYALIGVLIGFAAKGLVMLVGTIAGA